MAKGLIDPTTGERVSYSKRYIDDDVDEAPRGILVAKAGIPKRAAALMRVGQGATAVGRGARAAGRGVKTAARQPKSFLGGFSDNALEGHVARSEDALREGKIGTARRAGAVTSAMGGGLVAAYGVGSFNGRHDAMGNKRMGPDDRRKARAKAAHKGSASKRYDETALEHHGSRRVGGNAPVSSTHTAGLPVQSATFSRGNPEARPGTRSHALKLTQVHTRGTANRTGKLVKIGHSRSAAPGPMKKSFGKSAGFAQSGGSGRRLVNV